VGVTLDLKQISYTSKFAVARSNTTLQITVTTARRPPKQKAVATQHTCIRATCVVFCCCWNQSLKQPNYTLYTPVYTHNV